MAPGTITKLAKPLDGCRARIGPGVLARACQFKGWYKVAGMPGAYCQRHAEGAAQVAVQKVTQRARDREKATTRRQKNPHGVLYAPGTLVRSPGKGEGVILDSHEKYDVQWGQRTQYNAPGDSLEAVGGVKVRAAAMHARAPIANPKLRSDDTVQVDGREWRVIGVGATNEQGQTYYHLASTTEFIPQRNGRRPKQIGVWLPERKSNPPRAYAHLGYTKDWRPKFSIGQTVYKTLHVGPFDVVVKGHVASIRKRGEGRLGSESYSPHYDVTWDRVGKRDEDRLLAWAKKTAGHAWVHPNILHPEPEDRIPETYLRRTRSS